MRTWCGGRPEGRASAAVTPSSRHEVAESARTFVTLTALQGDAARQLPQETAVNEVVIRYHAAGGQLEVPALKHSPAEAPRR